MEEQIKLDPKKLYGLKQLAKKISMDIRRDLLSVLIKAYVSDKGIQKIETLLKNFFDEYVKAISLKERISLERIFNKENEDESNGTTREG